MCARRGGALDLSALPPHTHGHCLHTQIAQMEVEIPSMPLSIRKTFQDKLTGSKSSVDRIKKQVVRVDCGAWCSTTDSPA